MGGIMGHIVSYHESGQIATITMDDGKANAVSPQLVEELNPALDQAESDNAVVILTGRTGKFSAGFDLSVVKQGGEARVRLARSGAQLAVRLLGFPTPMILACNGHCLALGALLLLSADLRIGVKGHYKIGLNEVAIGMTLPYFGVEIARARLAPVYFSRSVVNAEIYTPQGAVEAGFLDITVPEEQLTETAMQSAQELTKLDMTAHYETKLRVRESALTAINNAIKRDFGN
jgi:enoyl-CoA hydratase